MELDLEGQYGKNFALDMAADLVEAGKMDQEDYDRFASIEDPDERRQAIAQWIQEQLNNGNLTLEDLEGHPWVEEWLDLREQKENAMKAEGQDYRSGVVAAASVSTDGRDNGNRDLGSDAAYQDKLEEGQDATEIAKANIVEKTANLSIDF